MKAAILVYGMYREFDYCIKRWVDIEKYLDCDYYFSTWTKSEQKYSDIDLFKKFDVTPNMITDYLPNCVYDIIDDDYIFPIKPPYPNSNMLMFHWKNLYKLMIDSGYHYDIVIIKQVKLPIKRINDQFIFFAKKLTFGFLLFYQIFLQYLPTF
jgi:hypothetical protein